MVSSTARDVRALSDDASADVLLEAALNATSNRLMDSLVHDARNPLNAISINLEVLTEKLKDENGELPVKVQKNLRAMREQIGRVDGILREYAEFMAPRASGAPEVEDLSRLVSRAVAVLGHEGRVKRVQTTLAVEPGVHVRVGDPVALRFVLVQAMFRALARAPDDSEVLVSLSREGSAAFLVVVDSGPEGLEPFPRALEAMQRAGERLGLQLRARGGEVRLPFAVL